MNSFLTTLEILGLSFILVFITKFLFPEFNLFHVGFRNSLLRWIKASLKIVAILSFVCDIMECRPPLLSVSLSAIDFALDHFVESYLAKMDRVIFDN